MNKLLDDYLCKKYPKIFIERNLPPTKTCLCWGLAVGNGWFSLINSLCEQIQHYINNHNECVDKGWELYVKKGKIEQIEQVVAKQVKEKFSSLRFYYSGGDDKIHGMVDYAENLSYSICEECGKMDETVGRNRTGWIVTSCKEHNNKNDFKLNCDKNLEEIWKQVREDEKHQKESHLS